MERKGKTIMGQRITKRTPGGVAYTGPRTKFPGMDELNLAGSLRVAAMREIMDRLAAYEDTGLSPEQITQNLPLLSGAK
jgi:hypothetical protein